MSGGRVVGVADEDLLRHERDLDRGSEAVDVEDAVVAEERQQVDGRQVARAVIDAEVLACTGCWR